MIFLLGTFVKELTLQFYIFPSSIFFFFFCFCDLPSLHLISSVHEVNFAFLSMVGPRNVQSSPNVTLRYNNNNKKNLYGIPVPSHVLSPYSICFGGRGMQADADAALILGGHSCGCEAASQAK